MIKKNELYEFTKILDGEVHKFTVKTLSLLHDNIWECVDQDGEIFHVLSCDLRKPD